MFLRRRRAAKRRAAMAATRGLVLFYIRQAERRDVANPEVFDLEALADLTASGVRHIRKTVRTLVDDGFLQAVEHLPTGKMVFRLTEDGRAKARW